MAIRKYDGYRTQPDIEITLRLQQSLTPGAIDIELQRTIENRTPTSAHWKACSLPLGVNVEEEIWQAASDVLHYTLLMVYGTQLKLF